VIARARVLKQREEESAKEERSKKRKERNRLLKLRLAEEEKAEKEARPQVSHAGIALKVGRVCLDLKRRLHASVARRAHLAREAKEHEAVLARKKKRLEKNVRVRARLEKEQEEKKQADERKKEMQEQIRAGIAAGAKRHKEAKTGSVAEGITEGIEKRKDEEALRERMQRVESFSQSVVEKELDKDAHRL